MIRLEKIEKDVCMITDTGIFFYLEALYAKKNSFQLFLVYI